MTRFSKPDAAGGAATIAAPTSLPIPGILLALAAIAVFALGLGIRLYDLTDQPLDFHATRQLRGAIIARGMYYEMLPSADPETRETAMAFWKSTGQYEPSILERLVALTYLATGGEKIWIARLYPTLFWMIGGLALFALARRMLAAEAEREPHMHAAALVALGFYLVLPFAVQASRSIQPDPGMVMGILLAVFAIYRWSETQSWKWAILAGVLGAIAILTKAVAAYILFGAAAGLVLYTLGFKRSLRSSQAWSMALVMILPMLVYYLTVREGRASDYFTSWTVDLAHLLLKPGTYVRWFNVVQNLMGLSALLLGLVGVLISQGRSRALLLGLWAGYGLYGLFLPYQMYTHTYYHLQLVPIIGLSLLPIANLVLERISREGRFLQVLFVVIALVGVGFPASQTITEHAQNDYRHEPGYWQEIASHLPTDGKILALTQDYGYRLMYYGWRKVILWPNRGEQKLSDLRGGDKEFETYFAKRIEGKDYFLITAFKQFREQKDLEQMLYEHYPVIAETDGYLIFDLTQPLDTAAP